MKKYISSFYILCAGTIFLSAFLLFQIQPLISKHILPWFGGGAMVWITALFFFMFVLLAGYLYVLILSYLTLRFQKYVHLLLISLVAWLLLYNSSIWGSSITPSISEDYYSSRPVLSILFVLWITIGSPFFVLSTTSSLLQLWYGKSTGDEPFSLYAISNIGSLLGLLSYPFLFEPIFTTQTQGMIWSGLFFLYLIGIILILIKTKFVSSSKAPERHIIEQKIQISRFLGWTWVASIPVMVMLTSTSYISGFVAAMPFIWIMPLALYLISFIISFRWWDRKIGWVTLLIVFFSSLIALLLMGFSGNKTIPILLIVLWMSVLSISHYCHEWLYEHRPMSAKLPWFYVALSLGGVLWSSIVLISTLFILKSPLEYVYILFPIMLVSLYQLYKYSLWEEFLSKKQLWILCGFALLVFGLFIYNRIMYTSQVVTMERNFYGSKKIIDYQNTHGRTIRGLTHEMTTHGFEYKDSTDAYMSYSYYTATSGIGRMMKYLREQSITPLDVGAIGLWAWILNTYCREGDSFTYFEIDPEVYTLAQKYFTFLSGCKNKEIKIGDARKLLSDEQKNTDKKYSIIVIDAYADDAVPAHLITTEAIKLYLSLLKENGVIAIHISSRYLDLLPVISGLAKDNTLEGRFYKDMSPPPEGSSSLWAILTKDTLLFQGQSFDMMQDISKIEPILWTDTKNALWQIVRFWK